jgi:L-lactate dehydrogenase complex protein LldG
MTTSREAFLQRVRQAAAEGNRAGATPSLEPRGTVGYQGAGPDPVARFAEQLAAAGGFPYVVPDGATAIRTVMDLVQRRPAAQILLGEGAALDALDLRRHLLEAGLQVTLVSSLNVSSSRDPFFAADIGISGVAYLVAETGSIVVVSRPDEPRSLSLLPPVHIAIAERRQLLPDLFDLFETLGAGEPLPSCLSLITGPSKTGDIELRLVTGVHGPGELHVILVTS